MKKICWISTFPNIPTSASNTTYMLIEDLLKTKKFDITLITYKYKDLNHNLPIKIYPILKKNSLSSSSLVKTLKILKVEDFDIIHINLTKFMYARIFLFLPFLAKYFIHRTPKIVISVHEYFDYSNLKEFLIGGLYHLFILKYSDLLLTFNNRIRKRILKKSVYNKKSDDIRFISKNVQSLRYDKIIPSNIWSKKEILPFILFFGFLRSNKGIHYLINAFKKIESNFPNLKLVIAGGISKIGDVKFKKIKNEYFNHLRKYIDKLNIKEKVIFTDLIYQEEIMELLNLSEIVIYPYTEIEQSGALFAALFSGKAIITTDIPAFKQILTNEKNCLFVKPKNSLEIAKAIVKILKNNNLKTKLESGARKVYLENSFDKLIQSYEIIFNEY